MKTQMKRMEIVLKQRDFGITPDIPTRLRRLKPTFSAAECFEIGGGLESPGAAGEEAAGGGCALKIVEEGFQVGEKSGETLLRDEEQRQECCSCSWRMATVEPLFLADGHGEHAVHFQQIDGGAAMGRNPHHSIAPPGKVFVPGLLARVKEQGFVSGERVTSRATSSFAE